MALHIILRVLLSLKLCFSYFEYNLYIIFCEGENLNAYMCDIVDRNMMYAFASKGIHIMYFNPSV